MSCILSSKIAIHSQFYSLFETQFPTCYWVLKETIPATEIYQIILKPEIAVMSQVMLEKFHRQRAAQQCSVTKWSR